MMILVFWGRFLDPILLEIANIGQITSNPVKIGRNHRDIATPHPLGVPGTFLGQFWKIDFHDDFDFWGAIFGIPFC